jgi:GT2 family glycosyltransferase
MVAAGCHDGEVVTRVYVSARGNVFMREIAEHLAESLLAVGRDAVVITDQLPAPTTDPLTNLVVAPHEFFGLFPAGAADIEAAAGRAVSINTEQAGTPFFDVAMRFAQRGPLVFDINPFSLNAVRRLGLTAIQLPLGYAPSMDHWRRDGAERGQPRNVDIAFMGGRTPRRERFLGGAASVLWEWRTDLRVFSWHRPVSGRAGDGAGAAFLAGAAKFEALADTRILLNVHRSDDPYFEWARVIEAVANGCVVVSETSTGTTPFQAGEHFVEAPLEYLAEQAVALAFDEPRRAAIADAAYEMLTRHLDQGALLTRALGEAATALSHRSVSRHSAHPAGVAVRTTPALAARARRLADAGKHLLMPGDGGRAQEAEVLRTTAGTLKRTYLAQVAHSRSIESLLSTALHGEPDPVTAQCTPRFSAAGPKPTVSVVIPLFDQGQYLREAVASVIAASSGAATNTELIIVDDHSTDDSVMVAEKLLDEFVWFPMALLRRAANGGLPVARNTGFRAARAPYVFALDADNVLYPSGLRTLVEHLDDAPPEVMAAYGILERFDETGSVGLTSHLPWDVDLLVQGAYIDAMALFRRSAWSALGEYHDSPDIYGWEDYDLWLSAAERGWRADLVPQFVGRYREQAGSMRRISDIDMASNFVTMRERHPRLPWPS